MARGAIAPPRRFYPSLDGAASDPNGRSYRISTKCPMAPNPVCGIAKHFRGRFRPDAVILLPVAASKSSKPGDSESESGAALSPSRLRGEAMAFAPNARLSIARRTLVLLETLSNRIFRLTAWDSGGAEYPRRRRLYQTFALRGLICFWGNPIPWLYYDAPLIPPRRSHGGVRFAPRAKCARLLRL